MVVQLNQPAVPPTTQAAAKTAAQNAQLHAAELASQGTIAVDELIMNLAIEGLPSTTTDPIKQTMSDAVAQLKQFSDAATAANTTCQAATTDADAIAAWRLASGACASAVSEYNDLETNIDRARRTPVVADLNRAAAVLVGTFTAITAALTAAGFISGDYTGFYRNHLWWAITYLTLAAVAVLVGTFAFLLDGVEANWKLRVEQSSIYFGVAAFGLALVIATVGLAVGASDGAQRPVLNATLMSSSTDGTTTVSSTATRSAVPNRSALVMAIWGVDGSGPHRLRFDVVGPGADGTVSHTTDTTVPSKDYTAFIVTAAVETAPSTPPAAPPKNCDASGSGTQSDPHAACATLSATGGGS